MNANWPSIVGRSIIGDQGKWLEVGEELTNGDWDRHFPTIRIYYATATESRLIGKLRRRRRERIKQMVKTKLRKFDTIYS